MAWVVDGTHTFCVYCIKHTGMQLVEALQAGDVIVCKMQVCEVGQAREAVHVLRTWCFVYIQRWLYGV